MSESDMPEVLSRESDKTYRLRKSGTDCPIVQERRLLGHKRTEETIGQSAGEERPLAGKRSGPVREAHDEGMVLGGQNRVYL